MRNWRSGSAAPVARPAGDPTRGAAAATSAWVRPRLLTALLAALLLCGLSCAARAEVYEVGAAQPIRSPDNVPWSRLVPGDRVVLHGTLAGGIVIRGHGSADRPIMVSAASGSVVTGSVVIEAARHIVIDGLTVRDSAQSAFILRAGAEAITIRNSQASGSAIGIWIGAGAGGGHRILDNVVHDNQGDGIAIDEINASPGQETVIAGNQIFGNGVHGLEINGNHYVVEHNIVHDNGSAMSGASGIHTYAKDANQDAGKHNIIRYNISYGNIDRSAQDGNGIQLDQWCDDNQVYFNLAFDNDGAGIVLFDAANNVVENNTLYGNTRDPGRSHAYKADLVVASDYTTNVDHAFGNVLRNNLVYALRAGHYAIYVNSFSARHMKAIGGNDFVHADDGSPLFFWAGQRGRDMAYWNTLKPGAPNVSILPRFLDPTRPFDPLSRRSGLELQAGSPLATAGVAGSNPAVTDLAGVHLSKLPIGAFGSR